MFPYNEKQKENNMINIKINNFDYKIIFVKEKDDRLLMNNSYHSGITDFIKKEIYIQEDLLEQSRTYTLMHEITHAVIDSFGMLQVEWNDEIVADFVAIHLHTFEKIFEQINRQSKKKNTDDFYNMLKDLHEKKGE